MDKCDLRLILNFDLASIPKTNERRFAVAATKSKVSSSSLSKVSIVGAALSADDNWACFIRSLNRRKLNTFQHWQNNDLAVTNLSEKTAKFSARLHDV